MKLKCDDGKVRDFEVAHCDGDHMPDGSRYNGYSEAYCKQCKKSFGVHDTKILKPEFKAHICLQPFMKELMNENTSDN